MKGRKECSIIRTTANKRLSEMQEYAKPKKSNHQQDDIKKLKCKRERVAE